MTGRPRNELRELIAAVRSEYGAFIDDELDVLSRWAANQYGAADALRDIIARTEPASELDVTQFVFLVICERWAAREIAGLAPEVTAGRRRIATLLPKRKHDLQRRLAKGEIRTETFSKHWEELTQLEAEISQAQRQGPPSTRSDKDGSRARTEFLRGLSKLVHDLTDGVWMDKQVADIASVVLAQEIQEEQVRNVNRATTRAARRARKSGNLRKRSLR